MLNFKYATNLKEDGFLKCTFLYGHGHTNQNEIMLRNQKMSFANVCFSRFS